MTSLSFIYFENKLIEVFGLIAASIYVLSETTAWRWIIMDVLFDVPDISLARFVAGSYLSKSDRGLNCR